MTQEETHRKAVEAALKTNLKATQDMMKLYIDSNCTCLASLTLLHGFLKSNLALTDALLEQ